MVSMESRSHEAIKDRGHNLAVSSAHQTQGRRNSGFVRLIGISGMTMALALPIGIVPRIAQNHELNSAQQKVVDRLPEVSVTRPEKAPTTRSITLPGSIEAIQDTALYARTDGFVKQFLVDIGDHVKAGQTLALIETPEVDSTTKESEAVLMNKIATRAQTMANIDQAKANLAKALADLSTAQANLVQTQSDEKLAYANSIRWRSLVQQGAVSMADGDDRQTRYETSKAARIANEDRITAAKAALSAARAQLAAQQSAVNASTADIDAAKASATRAQSVQGFQKVVAPFDAVVTERNIEAGALVTSGSDSSRSPLFHIARVDTLRVFVDVPQYAAPGVAAGQTASIALQEFPGRTFIGKVARTSFALDSRARTLRTEIHVANPKNILAPGMYADTTIVVPRTDRAFLVPSNSVIINAEGTRLAVLNGTRVELKKVQIGQDLGKQVEILDGLKGTEKVVLNPSDSLITGTLVSISK